MNTILRLLTTLILIGVVYVLGQMVVSGIRTYTQGASVIVSHLDTEYVHEAVRSYMQANFISTDDAPITRDASQKLIAAYIDTDDEIDLIAQIDDQRLCGTGGCITTLFLVRDGSLVPIPFGYAVQHIEVQSSVTNGMHDIVLNNNADTRLVWNGKQYRLD